MPSILMTLSKNPYFAAMLKSVANKYTRIMVIFAPQLVSIGGHTHFASWSPFLRAFCKIRIGKKLRIKLPRHRANRVLDL